MADFNWAGMVVLDAAFARDGTLTLTGFTDSAALPDRINVI